MNTNILVSCYGEMLMLHIENLINQMIKRARPITVNNGSEIVLPVLFSKHYCYVFYCVKTKTSSSVILRHCIQITYCPTLTKYLKYLLQSTKADSAWWFQNENVRQRLTSLLSSQPLHYTAFTIVFVTKCFSPLILLLLLNLPYHPSLLFNWLSKFESSPLWLSQLTI